MPSRWIFRFSGTLRAQLPSHRSWCFVGLLLAGLFHGPAREVRAEANPAASEQRERMQSIESYASATNDLGNWIWQATTHDDQPCRLWRSFEIPARSPIIKARLVMTVDNEFTLYLDGVKLGHGSEWRELFIFDLAPLLTPGRHVLAVDCYNGSFYAGMLLGLRIDLADGRSLLIKSDATWHVLPQSRPHWTKLTQAEPDWPAATVLAPLGGSPWWKQPAAVNLMPSLQPLQVHFWQTGWFQISLGGICAATLLASLWLVTQLVFQRRERHLLEAERTRIARDIHDDMGGRMTQLVVHVEVTQSELPAGAEMRSQLRWVGDEIRGLLATMDEVLWVVNPRCDTLSDFADYVCNYAQEFLKPTQMQCFFAVDPGLPPAPFHFPLRRSLLMAVKEALNNALKHSGATALHLEIHWQEPRLTVVVQDNGKGFDATTLKSGRNGLINMTQRLGELDGHCRITSRPGEGCRVELEIPLHRSLRSIWWRFWRQRSRPSASEAAPDKDLLTHPES